MSLVVTDTPDRVQAAGRIIAAFDKRPAEAVIDVEVLEVNRSKLQEFGLQIASPGSPGIDGSVDINRQNMTLDSLRKLGAADVFLSGLPALYYRLIRTDAKTRTTSSRRPSSRTAKSASISASPRASIRVMKSRCV